MTEYADNGYDPWDEDEDVIYEESDPLLEEIAQLRERVEAMGQQPVYYQPPDPEPDPQDAFDQAFERRLEILERQQQRELTDAEVQKLYGEAWKRGDPEHVAEGAVHDVAKKAGRVALANERIQELQAKEPPDTIEPLADDAGPKERAAFIDARMAGAEIAEPSPTTEND